MSRVHIYPNAVGAPPALPEKGTEEGDNLRTALNRASWDANHKRHGSFGADIWTDGGVLHAEQPECISAAAGHLYLPPSPHPVAAYGTSAGRLACSYTAEFSALCGSLAQFATQILIVLIAVDSQSLLQALTKGPLLTEEDHEDQIWFDLLAMANRGCTLVIQFFYSHVDFPPRNRTVDEAVTRLLEDPTLDHDTPGLWLTDVIRATHRFLYHAWLQTLADPRVTLCGPPARNCNMVPRGSNPFLPQSNRRPPGIWYIPNPAGPHHIHGMPVVRAYPARISVSDAG